MMLVFPNGNVLGWVIFALSNSFKNMLFFWSIWLFSKKYDDYISFSTKKKMARSFLDYCSNFKTLRTPPDTGNISWVLVINIWSSRNVTEIIQIYAVKKYTSLGK